MSSNFSFVQYVCEQIGPLGNILFKKVFEDYTIYYNKKCVGLISDNRFFVRITPEGEKAFPRLTKGTPYPNGADYFLIDDLQDSRQLIRLLKITWKGLPAIKKETV